MEKKICAVKVDFAGIYSWGDGWSLGMAKKFDECVANHKFYHWEYHKSNSACGCDYLVGTSGAIYLHPMGFETILKSCGVSDGHSYLAYEVREIYELCEDICNTCGGVFKMSVSEEKVASFELTDYSPATKNA